ncbi:MAG: hypothetical protein NTV23_09955 [Propionibacteriales bacterium]|nr:hypothetical protein [Propionibacteriales bacterium]
MRVRAIIVLLTAVVALGWAGQAFAAATSAVYYGSASAPIKAEDNSSDGNAWFHGAAAVIDHSWLRNRYWFKDSAPGGNSVYVTSDWYYNQCTAGGVCWQADGSDRSSERTSGTWADEEDYDDLDYQSNKGRVMTRVCENQNNSPDACSRYVYATMDY